MSVIIPTYNRYPLLLQAIDSVLNQDFTRFELIVVDDGSTDDTSRLRSSREIRYYPIPHCGYPGYVRNIGAQKAAGKYLAFLDSDDLWLKNKLWQQVEFMESHPRLGISHTREHWTRNNKTVSQAGQKHKREGMIFEDALKKCIIGPSTVMISSKLFHATGGFREDLEIAEDYEYWLRILCANSVGYIDRPLTIKQAGHPRQLSEKYGHIEYFRIQGLSKLVDIRFFPQPQLSLAKRELARKCRLFAKGCQKRNKTEEAERYNRLARLYGEEESR